MISLSNVHLSLGGRPILQGVDLTIQDGECLAVVGPNGCGKSTLLRTLGGLERPDRGEVNLPNRCTVGYLPQEANPEVDHSLEEELLGAFAEVRSAMQEMTELEARMAKTDPDSVAHQRVLERYAECSHVLEQQNGYAIEAQVRRVASGLGFSPGDLKRDCREFSGGWQMRILLAKLLLRRPNVLLLDEPTNHLDLESTLWLEQWIRTCGRTVVLVSHERATMDRLANRIVCMEHGTADLYSGDYSNYLKQSEAKRRAQWQAYERQQKEIRTMEAFIRRFRYNASRAAQVQSRIKQLEKIERIEPPYHPSAIHFDFPAALPSYREVLRLENLGHAYGDLQVFSGLNLAVHRGERIGLVGVNGAGKSTLLRLLCGREKPTEGTLHIGGKVESTYFAQYDATTLDSKDTLLQAIEATAPVGQAARARDLLGAFLFTGDDVDKPVRALSGGERTRFRLAQILFSPANLLLLDEPTNHLDVTSRATVEQALRDYTGTVVLVSHDRVFMDCVTNRIVEIAGGALRVYPGKYSDYLTHKERLLCEQAGESPGNSSLSQTSPSPGLRPPAVEDTTDKEQRIRQWEQRKARLRQKERLAKNIDRREQSIALNEARSEEIDQEMANPSVAADYSRLAPLIDEKQRLEHEHQEMLEQWEALHNRLEALQDEENEDKT